MRDAVVEDEVAVVHLAQIVVATATRMAVNSHTAPTAGTTLEVAAIGREVATAKIHTHKDNHKCRTHNRRTRNPHHMVSPHTTGNSLISNPRTVNMEGAHLEVHRSRTIAVDIAHTTHLLVVVVALREAVPRPTGALVVVTARVDIKAAMDKEGKEDMVVVGTAELKVRATEVLKDRDTGVLKDKDTEVGRTVRLEVADMLDLAGEEGEEHAIDSLHVVRSFDLTISYLYVD